MTSPKILVIDDEKTVQDAIQRALKGQGYDLLFASNGKDGLKLLKQKQPSLVFLDLKMPVMDGVEFMKAIKLTHDSPYHVVIITGHGDEEDIAQCYKLGANSFLRKPLSMTEIDCLTKRCLWQKEIEAELAAQRNNLASLVDQKTKKISEQLDFQQRLIDAIPTPIYFKNPKHEIIGTNTAFRSFFDITEKKVTGKTFATFMAAAIAKSEKIKDDKMLKSGRSQHYQTKIASAKNSLCDVIFNKAVFKDQNGQTAGIIGAIVDVSDLENTYAKLKEKSAALSHANMSLRILIKQLSDAQTEDRKANMPNLKELVMPNSDQLESILDSPTERAYLENIMLNLNRVTSPFAKELSQLKCGLSPKEIQVADLIRIGLSNKESAIQMNVTKSTVEFHRDNLRKKLGLKHEKKNLRAYLMSLEAKYQKSLLRRSK
jgi:DNA-binding NarL/FixJ family response regulator